MAEEKKPRKRVRKPALVEPKVITPEAKPEQAPAVEQPKPTPKEESNPAPKTIKPTASKGIVTTDRYKKLVATQTVSGRYGHTSFAIETGKTYTLPTELAQWLARHNKAEIIV